MTKNVPRIAVQIEITRGPDIARNKYRQDPKSLSSFVFKVKTMPTIKRKNATPMRPTKSGRRSGNARATGGSGLSARGEIGACGAGGEGGIPVRSGRREPQ